MTAAPDVSIIMPTYNRADTIGRAIGSVLAQSFTDWELLIVDDGSVDGTAELVTGMDPRIRLIRQANAGVGAARNTGLAAARGRFLTFLDSDDAWLPHFLELTSSFLRQSPNEHFVTTEFNQDYGAGHVIRHNVAGITAYASFAHSVGARSLDLPKGETDDYLRIYERREPAGDWAKSGMAQASLISAYLYSGNIFRHMRWGYLNWLPVTMLTRHAFETIGPFVTQTRSAGDFRFLGLLAKNFRANMIGIPSAVKYERALGSSPLKQDHLATGGNSYAFEVNKMAHFDELFRAEFAIDPELVLIRRHYQLYAGLAALRAGMRTQALSHLSAAACWKSHLRLAYGLLLLVHLAPTDQSAAVLVDTWVRTTNLVWRLWKGHTTFSELGRKAFRLSN